MLNEQVNNFNNPHLNLYIDSKAFDRISLQGLDCPVARFNDFLEAIKNIEEKENCLFMGFDKNQTSYFERYNRNTLLEIALKAVKPSFIGEVLNLYFMSLNNCTHSDKFNAFSMGFNKHVKYSSKFMYKLIKDDHTKNINTIVDFLRECQDIQEVNNILNAEFDSFEEADQFIKTISRPSLKAYNNCCKVYNEVLKFYQD